MIDEQVRNDNNRCSERHEVRKKKRRGGYKWRVPALPLVWSGQDLPCAKELDVRW